MAAYVSIGQHRSAYVRIRHLRVMREGLVGAPSRTSSPNALMSLPNIAAHTLASPSSAWQVSVFALLYQ